MPDLAAWVVISALWPHGDHNAVALALPHRLSMIIAMGPFSGSFTIQR